MREKKNPPKNARKKAHVEMMFLLRTLILSKFVYLLSSKMEKSKNVKKQTVFIRPKGEIYKK